MHLELEVNLLVCNVIEREIEREKVQMKPSYISVGCEAYEYKVRKEKSRDTLSPKLRTLCF